MAKYKVVKPLSENRLPYKEGDDIDLTPERAAQLGDLVEPAKEIAAEKEPEKKATKSKMMTSKDLKNK
jgi:hypothetical protein